MNVLVPIGGWDRYFREEDFAFPKPLIEISGAPLIEHTLRCLCNLDAEQHFTFVVRDEDCRRFSLDNILRIVTEGKKSSIVRLHAPTQGAVCSCLWAIDQLDPDEELVISNSDQVIRGDLSLMIQDFRRRKLDAATLTFDSTHPRFSYVRLDEDDLLSETSEKRVISRIANAGLYYFRRSQDFIDGAMRLLNNATPVQGGYFVSQVLNELVLDGKRIGRHHITQDRYFPLYTPQKVAEYEKNLAESSLPHSRTKRPVLVIPMAGEGRRFVEAKYDRPKPFIDVAGKPMIERVLENLNHTSFQTVVIARSSHLSKAPQMGEMLKEQGVKVVSSDGLTEGTACTVLLARTEIDPEAPLVVANCDQIIDFDCRGFLEDCLKRGLDGSILVFRDPTKNPKWSFARLDENGLVAEVKEKVAISDLATVGVYLFAKGRHFANAAIDMIARNERVNGEFYTCPVYNYMIQQGLRVGVYEIPLASMHGLGVPEDLEAYLSLLSRESAVEAV